MHYRCIDCGGEFCSPTTPNNCPLCDSEDVEIDEEAYEWDELEGLEDEDEEDDEPDFF